MKIFLFLICILFVFTISCSENNSNDKKKSISPDEKKYYDGFGIGPISSVLLSDTIDQVKLKEGDEIFKAKCTLCHQLSDERKIGPGLKDVTLRRRPEWIMNQILNPLEMSQKDSLTKELLSIYLSQMTDMDLTESDARSVLEFLRSNDLR